MNSCGKNSHPRPGEKKINPQRGYMKKRGGAKTSGRGRCLSPPASGAIANHFGLYGVIIAAIAAIVKRNIYFS